jgi:hypothetical protein
MPAKKQQDPNEIVHVQVKPGATVVWGEHAYGDRATLQLTRGELDQLEGDYELLGSGSDVPDVGELPAA